MYIDTEIQKSICFFYLNRERTNSLNQEMLDEIYNKMYWVSQQDEVKVVILLSRRSFGFSSGLDLSSFMDDRKSIFAERVYNAVLTSCKIVQFILRSPKIYIAALSGPVVGSAASIAFSCDFRFAEKGTWFWLPDVQYGGLLADGGIELLVNLIGTSRAHMLGLTNDRLNLEMADKWGLIYKITECQMLKESVRLFAKKLCGFSFLSVSLQKKIINDSLPNSFPEKYMKMVLDSDDAYQRLRMYLQKNNNDRE